MLIVLLIIKACCWMSSGPLCMCDMPASFPVASCDAVIEFQDAGALIDTIGGGESFCLVLGILGGEELSGALAVHDRSDQPALLSAVLKSGAIGCRGVDDDENSTEWVAWIGPEAGTPQSIMQSLKPVRDSQGFYCPRLGLQGVRVFPWQGGLLLGSAEHNELFELALSNKSVPPAQPCSARMAITEPAPIIATIKNNATFGGRSAVSFALNAGEVAVDYHGRFKNGPLTPPQVARALDLEVLERMPEGLLAVIVEQPDATILPGEGLIGEMFPYLLDPEPSDELRKRRIVVVSETTTIGPIGPDGTPTEIRVPALCVAVEVSGKGATARRQDLAVLTSLASLRNRFGVKAGLQHLPTVESLPQEGARCVDTRALFGPVFGGHPIASSVSMNWCQTCGPQVWQLYATTPELAAAMTQSLQGAPSRVDCCAATQVGRVDARMAAGHLRNWGGFTAMFGSEELDSLSVVVESTARFLDQAEQIEWSIYVPDSQTLDASIRILPRTNNDDEPDA